MFRGLLLVVVTLLVLIASVVGVVAAGMHRIAAAQKEANAAWRPPAPVLPTPATEPAYDAMLASDFEEASPPKFDSINLGAKDAALHGAVQCAEQQPDRRKKDSPREGKAAERFRQMQLMGGRSVTNYLTAFNGAEDYAEWNLDLPKAATYEISLTYACPKWIEARPFVLRVGNKELPIMTESTRSEASYRVVVVGRLALAAGRTKLALRPAPASIRDRCFMNLRGIQLIAVPAGP